MWTVLLCFEEAELAANHITLFGGYRGLSSFTNHVPASDYSERSVIILDHFLEKNGCRCCLEWSIMSWSILTTDNFFETDETVSYHSSGTKTYSSVCLIFSVWANAQSQGINKWPRSEKLRCILRNLPDAVSEFKNWAIKMFLLCPGQISL
jgi:hypothetical protein